MATSSASVDHQGTEHQAMARHLIVAQFVEYAAAHGALCELIQAGFPPNHIGVVAGDRSNSQGANRDLGILERDADRYLPAVRRGRTLVAVEADESARARVLEIIEDRAPIEIGQAAAAE